jgi:CDP-2,3-bis-(O-geranylgeranyl)-sn-glycerol synthase
MNSKYGYGGRISYFHSYTLYYILDTNMFKFILSCFYFFLPAYFTNMTPSLVSQLGFLKSWAKPIDLGKKFAGKPFLGDHKTWRGVILGPTAGILIVFLQKYLFSKFAFIEEISFFNYQEVNILFFALLITLGTICGDLFFAFIKRRLNLRPGARFLPFDQINYVIGAAIFLTLFSGINIAIEVWVTILILTFLLHLTATQLGFLLGLSRSKW